MGIKIKKIWKFFTYSLGLLSLAVFSTVHIGPKSTHKSLLGDEIKSSNLLVSPETAHADVLGGGGCGCDTQDCGSASCSDSDAGCSGCGSGY